MTGRPPAGSLAARDWLARREPRPPEPLLARMDAALVGRSEPHIPDALAGAAFDRLRAALASGADRAAAWDLLTADALLTYAIEAAAERGAEGLAELARLASPLRFAELLDATDEEPARR